MRKWVGLNLNDWNQIQDVRLPARAMLAVGDVDAPTPKTLCRVGGLRTRRDPRLGPTDYRLTPRGDADSVRTLAMESNDARILVENRVRRNLLFVCMNG